MYRRKHFYSRYKLEKVTKCWTDAKVTKCWTDITRVDIINCGCQPSQCTRGAALVPCRYNK